MKCYVLLLLSVVALSCSSQPQQYRYYLLANPADEVRNNTVNEPLVKITLTRLTLASYLTQSKLALLQGDNQVVFANQNFWAEPLREGLQRVLVYEFNQLGKFQLLVVDEPAAHNSDFQLQLQIDQFLPADSGVVTLSGKFWLLEGDKLLRTENFDLREPLNRDGYSHAVEIQRQLLAELALALNKAVK